MKVIVQKARPDSAVIEVELATGGPFLILSVNQEHYGEDSQFKRVFNARIRRTGPRGGWRGEPETIGYGVFDIRSDVRND